MKRCGKSGKSKGKRQKSKVKRAALDLRNSDKIQKIALLPNPTFAF
jgi:hypothetical protein